jgi:predicted NAD/FAD-binding protein
MKVAIIGSGISGLTAAYLLNQKYEVTVFEAADRLGGHTATIDVNLEGKEYKIDTGFIVFNDWTYPNFKKLLSLIGVTYQPTSMGFSVSSEVNGLEYSGKGLNTLFAQRRNFFNVKHWRMIRDILRFNQESPRDVEQGGKYSEMTLAEYLRDKKYSTAFIDYYLIPMGSAIWSASVDVMENFPLQFFVRFFRNHGLLSVKNRPQWHVIKGGSRSYIAPMILGFKDRIKLSSPIKKILRKDDHVSLVGINNETHKFDQVVIATHSDQALSMLADANQSEKNVLGNIAYQSNEVVLHTDTGLLPKNKSTWSSWNYRIVDEAEQSSTAPPVLTYNMNILQGINADKTFCVTLNKKEAIDPQKIIGRYYYDHPVFSFDTINAQKQWPAVNGINRTWFCGAYWGNGFHEDGVVSGMRVAEQFGCYLDQSKTVKYELHHDNLLQLQEESA